MVPVPPIGSDQLLILLVQLSALLLSALLLGRLAIRLGLPPIAGELLAGLLLGPTLLGNLFPTVHGWLFPASPSQMHMLDAVAYLGVLLLVGVAGLSLNSAMLRRRIRAAAQISACGLLLPIAIGISLGLLAPDIFIPETTERTIFALFLAVAISVTAIAVIAKILADMKLIDRDVGQLILTVAMLDDTIAWLLLSVVAALATVGLQAQQVGQSVLLLILFVLFAVFIGRRMVGWSVRLAGRSTEDAPVVAAAVVIVLLGASATHALRLEALFGAFVAGILIGELPAELRQRLAPLRTVVMGVLAPIFLATAGLRVDLAVLGDPRVLLATVIVLLAAILTKLGGAYLGARLAKLSHWEGVAVGSGMNARGVVGIVMAMVGLRLEILDVTAFTVIALVAIATSLMAPPLLRLAMSKVVLNADEQLRLTRALASGDRAVRGRRPAPPPGRGYAAGAPHPGSGSGKPAPTADPATGR